MLKGEMMEGDRIQVTEAVYKAGMSFDELVDGEGFLLAEVIEDCYRRSENEPKRKHWRTISDFLKHREFAEAGTPTLIVP